MATRERHRQPETMSNALPPAACLFYYALFLYH